MKKVSVKFFASILLIALSPFSHGAEGLNDSLIGLYKSESAEAGKDLSAELLESTKRILESGADIDEVDEDGKSALMYAVSISNELASYLVENGADVNKGNRIERSALFFAAENGSVETVRMLVEHGADIEHEDTYSFGLLVWAAKSGNVPVIEYLISKGLAVDEPSGYRYQTPLMAAAESGEFDAVKYLISQGARIDYANETGQSVLMGARNPEVVRFLVEKGAQVNRKNSLGFTPLVFAVLNGNTDALETLISLGANPNDRGQHDEPILSIAMRYKNPELIRILIDGGVDLEKPLGGMTPFVAVAKHGMVGILIYLKEKGVDPRANPEALLQASLQSHLETMEWLLDEGVPIDYKDSRYGQTALHVAVSVKQLEAVKFLLEKGADPSSINSKGESVYDRAERLRLYDILDLLKQYEAKGES